MKRACKWVALSSIASLIYGNSYALGEECQYGQLCGKTLFVTFNRAGVVKDGETSNGPNYQQADTPALDRFFLGTDGTVKWSESPPDKAHAPTFKKSICGRTTSTTPSVCSPVICSAACTISEEGHTIKLSQTIKAGSSKATYSVIIDFKDDGSCTGAIDVKDVPLSTFRWEQPSCLLKDGDHVVD